jgi:hypothetical protein
VSNGEVQHLAASRTRGYARRTSQKGITLVSATALPGKIPSKSDGRYRQFGFNGYVFAWKLITESQSLTKLFAHPIPAVSKALTEPRYSDIPTFRHPTNPQGRKRHLHENPLVAAEYLFDRNPHSFFQ